MSTVRFRRHALACLTAALMLATRSNVWAQQLDTVLTWNQVMATALVVPGANPATVFVSRPLAIVGVAMFDAANAFEKAKTTDSMKCKLTGRNKAGEAINLSMMLNPVRDGFNQVIGVSAITRDIWTQAQKDEWRKRNGATASDDRQVA